MSCNNCNSMPTQPCAAKTYSCNVKYPRCGSGGLMRYCNCPFCADEKVPNPPQANKTIHAYKSGYLLNLCTPNTEPINLLTFPSNTQLAYPSGQKINPSVFVVNPNPQPIDNRPRTIVHDTYKYKKELNLFTESQPINRIICPGLRMM